MQSQLTDLETYLATLSTNELRDTAEMQGVEIKSRREVLTSVARDKASIAALVIKAEEEKHGGLSQWGVDRVNGLPLDELKAEARSLGVSLTKQAYRDRLVHKTNEALIYALMYETKMSEIF